MLARGQISKQGDSSPQRQFQILPVESAIVPLGKAEMTVILSQPKKAFQWIENLSMSELGIWRQLTPVNRRPPDWGRRDNGPGVLELFVLRVIEQAPISESHLFSTRPGSNQRCPALQTGALPLCYSCLSSWLAVSIAFMNAGQLTDAHLVLKRTQIVSTGWFLHTSMPTITLSRSMPLSCSRGAGSVTGLSEAEA